MRISPARLATKFTPNCVLDLRNVGHVILLRLKRLYCIQGIGGFRTGLRTIFFAWEGTA